MAEHSVRRPGHLQEVCSLSRPRLPLASSRSCPLKPRQAQRLPLLKQQTASLKSKPRSCVCNPSPWPSEAQVRGPGSRVERVQSTRLLAPLVVIMFRDGQDHTPVLHGISSLSWLVCFVGACIRHYHHNESASCHVYAWQAEFPSCITKFTAIVSIWTLEGRWKGACWNCREAPVILREFGSAGL